MRTNEKMKEEIIAEEKTVFIAIAIAKEKIVLISKIDISIRFR